MRTQASATRASDRAWMPSSRRRVSVIQCAPFPGKEAAARDVLRDACWSQTAVQSSRAAADSARCSPSVAASRSIEALWPEGRDGGLSPLLSKLRRLLAARPCSDNRNMAKILIHITKGRGSDSGALGSSWRRAQPRAVTSASRTTHSSRAARFYVSGMSSKARGFEPNGVAEPAMASKLVELALEHDRVLTY
jgi:hypothetical protein